MKRKESWEKAPKNQKEVCHQWASRKKESATKGNISFKKDTIYSYNWYAMARWFTDAKGEDYVIMTRNTYSSCTAKHMSYVRRAIPLHVKIYFTDEVESRYYSYRSGPVLTPEAVQRTMLKEAKKWYEDSFRKIMYKYSCYATPEENKRISEKGYKDAEEFCKRTGMPFSQDFGLYLISDYEIKVINIIAAEAIKQREERERKAEEKQDAIERAYNDFIIRSNINPMEMALCWMRGEIDKWGRIRIPEHEEYVRLTGVDVIYIKIPTCMRIEGEDVVTNMSARVPVRHAKLLWEAIKAGKEVIGMRVGLYTVSSMNGELVVGCHHISREIINKFVEYYKW